MLRTRSDAGASTLGGKIYMVGGFDGVAPTFTAEVICPGRGNWKMIKSMRVCRSGVKTVAMDGLLFVVGGWDGQQRLMRRGARCIILILICGQTCRTRRHPGPTTP